MIPTGFDAFSNVAQEDHLSLYRNGRPNGRKIISLLRFKTGDVAMAARIPAASVRYDQKMPAGLKACVEEWANLINLVAQRFQGNARKTALWLTTINPMMGNVSPRDMIRSGRYKKLLEIVLSPVRDGTK